MDTESIGKLTARRAVEALRNGVPNRAAVEILGCDQPAVEERFDALLSTAENAGWSTRHEGMLVSGDFGSGKSHLLAYLEQLALSQGFVCSRIAISKETPLYDLGKVFLAAMESGRLPERKGRFIEELAHRVFRDADLLRNFSDWTERHAGQGLSSLIFPATLRIYQAAMDLELNADIEAFWAGEKIHVSKVKKGLRQLGEAHTYQFRAPRISELPPQRLRFAVELIRAAGYRGWVVLLDEIELIGSYSILQRSRSYAEIARWMGRISHANYPGLITVGAVTEDFATAIISPDGPKKDRDYVRPRLEQSARHADLAGHAEVGMQLLEQQCLPLARPSDENVNATIEMLRKVYGRAYDWEAPSHFVPTGGAGFRNRMRYKVRSAINEWDLRRLDPTYKPNITMEEFDRSYEEDTSLERPSNEDET